MKKLLILIPFLAFLYSCGEDSVVNNPNIPSNETLIWEKDSVNLEGAGNIYRHFRNIVNDDTTIKQIRFSFTSETDCIPSDSAYSELFLDNPDTVFTLQIIRTFNTSHTYTINVNKSRLDVGVSLFFNSPTTRFLRFKNLKAYKTL